MTLKPNHIKFEVNIDPIGIPSRRLTRGFVLDRGPEAFEPTLVDRGVWSHREDAPLIVFHTSSQDRALKYVQWVLKSADSMIWSKALDPVRLHVSRHPEGAPSIAAWLAFDSLLCVLMGKSMARRDEWLWVQIYPFAEGLRARVACTDAEPPFGALTVPPALGMLGWLKGEPRLPAVVAPTIWERLMAEETYV